jgi:hypothetical protein
MIRIKNIAVVTAIMFGIGLAYACVAVVVAEVLAYSHLAQQQKMEKRK